MYSITVDASDTLCQRKITPFSWHWLSLFYVFLVVIILHFAAEWRYKIILIEKKGGKGEKTC